MFQPGRLEATRSPRQTCLTPCATRENIGPVISPAGSVGTQLLTRTTLGSTRRASPPSACRASQPSPPHGQLAGSVGLRGASARSQKPRLEGKAEPALGRRRRPHDPDRGSPTSVNLWWQTVRYRTRSVTGVKTSLQRRGCGPVEAAVWRRPDVARQMSSPPYDSFELRGEPQDELILSGFCSKLHAHG